MLSRECSLAAAVLWMTVCTAALLAGTPEPALAQADLRPRGETWGTNGPVWAMKAMDNALYIGGNFTYVGPETGNLVRISAVTNQEAGFFPNVRGTVYACIPDALGGWYIGGDFLSVSGLPRDRLAHILLTGEVDPQFNPGADKTVYALALGRDRTTLYVGGRFTQLRGASRPYLGAVNALTGDLYPWSPAPDGFVRTMVFSSDQSLLYVGGNFLHLGGANRAYLAAIDTDPSLPAADWLSDWHPVADGSVETMVLAEALPSPVEGEGEGEVEGEGEIVPEPEDLLYVGGWFSRIGGGDRSFIAAIGAESSLATPWNPAANNPVFTLAVDDTKVYAGGAFNFIGFATRKYIAALDRVTAEADPDWNPGLNGIDDWVTALALSLDGTNLYVGGRFSQIDGVDRARLAALNTSTGDATTWDPGAGGVTYVLQITNELGIEMVHAGGELTTVNGKVRHRLAAFDLPNNESLPEYGTANDWDPHANDAVLALEVSDVDNMVYVGGQFTKIGLGADLRTYRYDRSYLAAIHANRAVAGTYGEADLDWIAGTTGTPEALNDAVYALALGDGAGLSSRTLYVGGKFTTPGDKLFAADADPSATGGYGKPSDSWGPVWSTDPTAVVNTLAWSPSQNRVFVGGSMPGYLGQVLCLEGDTGAENWQVGADYPVVELELAEDPASAATPLLYAGGLFTQIGGQSRDCLAAINAQSGALDDWAYRFNGEVGALWTAGPQQPLFVSGNFTAFGPLKHIILPVRRMVALDTSVDPAELMEWDVAVDDPVYAFEPDDFDQSLFAGGAFTGIGNPNEDNTGFLYASRSHLAQFFLTDTLPPVITLNGPNPLVVECGTPWSDPGAIAIDNRPPYVIPVPDPPSPDTSVVGDYILTYTAEDEAGNVASTTRLVRVVDTTPPVIRLNGSAFETVECRSPYTDPGATAFDSCDTSLPPVSVSGTVNTNASGTYTLTYTITDASGNPADSVTRTVQVTDTDPPVITLTGSPAVTLDCGTSYFDAGATATDSCDGDLTSMIQMTGAVDTNLPGVYTLVYNVTDTAGNTAVTLTRVVTVEDILPPVIVLTGAAAEIVECGTAYTDPGATASDLCDGDLTAAILVNGAVNAGLPGVYTLTYSVSDAAGNPAAPVTRTVQVTDTLSPTVFLNSPEPFILECSTAFADPVSAFDQCDGDLTPLIVTTGAVNTTLLGTYLLAYSVEDSAGNSAALVTRTVEVTDTTPPVITLLGSDRVTVECGDAYADAGATASDTCEGDLTAAITVSGAVNTGAPGTYPLIYAVLDSSGNAAVPAVRTVDVVDTAPPLILLSGAAVLTVQCGSPYTDAGATALDQCDGDLTAAIVVSGAVNVNVNGPYLLAYAVSDAAGNAAAVVTRTVVITDTLPPAIALNSPEPLPVECNGIFVDPVTAFDQCDGDLTAAIVTTGTVDTGIVTTFPLAYSVTDSAGLGDTASRTVQVTDTAPPVITLVGADPFIAECGSVYRDPGAIGIDLCEGDLTPAIIVSGNVYTSTLGTYLLNFNLTDSTGNAAVPETRTVQVVDQAPPVITLLGPDPFQIPCGAMYSDPGATAFDQCEGDLTAAVVTSGLPNTNVVESFSVSYDVVDTAGNTSTSTRLVQVIDPVPPVITLLGPDPLLVECGGVYADPGATAFDQCRGDLTADIVTSGFLNTGVVGVYTLSYDVSDPAGNPAATATRRVEIFDSAAPMITLLGPDPLFIECGDAYADPGVTAFDQCDGDLTAAIVTSGTPNTGVVGAYTVSYGVSDAAGNPAPTATRRVNVHDTLPPVITLGTNFAVPPVYLDGFLELPLGTPFTEPLDFVVEDACDGPLLPLVTSLPPVNPAQVIAYAWALDPATKEPLWTVSAITPDTYAYDVFVGLPGYYLLIYETMDSHGNRYPRMAEGGYPPIFLPGSFPDPIGDFLDGTDLKPEVAAFARLVHVTDAKAASLPLAIAKALLVGFASYDINGDGVLSSDELDRAYLVLSAAYPDLTPELYALFVKEWSAGSGMLTRSQIAEVIQVHEAPCTPDETAPEVFFQDVTLNLDALGMASLFQAFALYTTPAITYLYDNCDGPGDANPGNFTITAVPANFGCGAIGPVNVALTVTDSTGNSTTGNITVTVANPGGVCAEGEGEPPAEGEGEPPAEGEAPAEGEITGEGEPPAEGEGEDGGEDEAGCCRCNDSNTPQKFLHKFVADWLLVGLSLVVLIALGTATKS